MGSRRVASSGCVAAWLVLAAAGCGQARSPQAAQPGTQCVACHGGADNQTGAPPPSLSRATDPSVPAVGAHAAHVTAGSLARAFGCEECHPDPRISPGRHMNGQVDLAFGPLAATGGATPAYSPADHGCRSTYCHGATLPGGTLKSPTWTTVDGSQAGCGTCHGVPPGGKHPQNPNCGNCHPGYTQNSVNPATHVNGTVDLSGLTCTTCHGNPQRGATALNPQLPASPPLDTLGNGGTTSPGVGAHQAHLNDGPLRGALACTECHAVPTSTATHPTGTLDLTWGPLATADGAHPVYAGGTCSSTYCHGATLGAGGTNQTPSWTGGSGEVACGTCHGIPPTSSSHPAVTGGLGACSVCHPATVDTTGAIIPTNAGGKHLDGIVEAIGHSASWMDTASAGFHAYSADSNIAACQACHGPNLDGLGGLTAVGCGQCHDAALPPGVTSWKTNCVMCHGGTDNQSGAPPKAIWGYAGDPSRGGGTADPVRVGAHSAHVAGRSSDGTALSAPFDCGVCHVKPADALSAGHLDGTTATVAFSGLASQGVAAGPTWTRAAATCSATYCHGSFKNGANATPIWTQPGPVGCTSCHGAPPGGSHVQNPSCGNCHPGYTQNSVNPATHVNGTVDLVGLTCTTCHGNPERAATALNPQLPAAPPLDTFGNGDTTSPGVGAHQAHLNDGPLRGALACTECHAVPTSTATHPTGALDLTWGTLATTGAAQPAYAGGTCSSTYCHGATLQAGGTNQAPRWTGGSGEVACGTCHGIPPPSPPHPAVTGGLGVCSVCHPATADATGAIIPASAGGEHLDGIVQASGGHDASWMDQTSLNFHAYSANQGLGACQGCHGANLDGVGGLTTVGCGQCHDTALPEGATSWMTNCLMCHGGTDNASGAPPRTRWPGGTSTAARGVGAHSSHVTGRVGGGSGTALSAPFDCAACHVRPASALSGGHVDGLVQVGGYTGSDPALAAAVGDPGWTPAAATCATAYCHGATLLAGSLTAPSWTTVDGSQAACGTCHGLPPPSGTSIGGYSAHNFHVSLQEVACSRCHGGYTQATVDPALHVNGIRDVLFQYGVPDPANPDPVAACLAPITLTARISGWDCTTCHTYKDAWANACCGTVICN